MGAMLDYKRKLAWLQRQYFNPLQCCLSLRGDSGSLCPYTFKGACICCCCSVIVVSKSLWHHGLQHAKLHVLHYLPGFAQIHVHWVGDAIQASHPLSPYSPPALNLSQLQGLFQWVSYSHHVVKVLEVQLQHQSFQRILRIDYLYDWLVWFPWCPRDSQESSPTPQFKSISS